MIFSPQNLTFKLRTQGQKNCWQSKMEETIKKSTDVGRRIINSHFFRAHLKTKMFSYAWEILAVMRDVCMIFRNFFCHELSTVCVCVFLWGGGHSWVSFNLPSVSASGIFCFVCHEVTWKNSKRWHLYYIRPGTEKYCFIWMSIIFFLKCSQVGCY